MLLTKKIKTRIVPLNYNRLKKIYPDIKFNDIIEIDVTELSEKSPIKVECECDICKTKKTLDYRKYIINKKRYGYYSCKKCKNKKTEKTKEKLYGDPQFNNSKKMVATKEKLGIYIPLNLVSDFKKYRKLVNRFTYKNKKIIYETWNGFDFYDNEYIKDNFNFSSKNMCYPTIDHKISIHEGFLKNIPPYIIGGKENLCITKRRINLLKRNTQNFNYETIIPQS